MFKLSRSQLSTRDDLLARLQVAEADLGSAIERYNELLESAQGGVQAALQRFNDLLTQAQEFCTEVAGEAQSEWDERSEKWQEGDNGQAAASWIESWESAAGELDEIEVDFPDPVEVDAPGWEDALNSPESYDSI